MILLQRRRFLLLAAGALGLAACSPAASGPSASTSATAPSAPSSAAPSPVPAAASAQPGPSPSLSPAAAASQVAPAASASASAVAAAGAAPVGGPPDITSIDISYDSISSPSLFVLIVAAQKFDQRYGLTFNTSFVNGINSVSGLLAGSLQFQEGSGVSAIQAMASGAALRILGCFQNTNTYAIFAGPQITSVEDLRGKTVAIAERGSNPDISLRAALAPYGLVVDQDVSALTVGNDPSRLAAVLSGNVDAAILDEGSFGPRAQAQGLHVVLSLRDEKLPWVGSAPVTTTSFVQQHPSTVLAVLQALIAGMRFLQDPANRAACLPTIASAMSVAPDDPQVADFYAATVANVGVYDPTSGATTIVNALKQVNAAQYGSLSPDQVVDTSFLTRLVNAGAVTLDG